MPEGGCGELGNTGALQSKWEGPSEWAEELRGAGVMTGCAPNFPMVEFGVSMCHLRLQGAG